MSIEQPYRSFLWKGDATNAYGKKVKWDLVRRPRKKGGVGIRKVDNWNIACLIRIFWLLFCGFDSIQISSIHTWLLKNRSFWYVLFPSHSS